MPSALVPDMRDVLALQDRIDRALRSIPDVTGLSAADTLPLSANSDSTGIAIPGAPGNTGDREHDYPIVDSIATRAGYVEVMGMRLRAGRPFRTERSGAVREALIDTQLANRLFPAGSALGAKVLFRDGDLTIVGVVDQARMYRVSADGRPQLFVRAEDWGYHTLYFVVRTRRDPRFLVADVRAEIRRIEPRLAVADVRTMDEIVSDTLRQQRMSAALIAGFAAGAVLLAAMGLVSVVSGSVTRRRHELAVRIALGAEHRRVLRLVVAEGARLVALGVLIGIPGIYAAGRVIGSTLVGVSPSDPVTLVATALGLSLVGIGACYVPARRVLRIDPAQSLRQE
jgi:putative ABC transport system permease protein